MARKNYSEEFRRQAVDLYESTPGRHVARDRRRTWGSPAAPCGTGSPRLTGHGHPTTGTTGTATGPSRAPAGPRPGPATAGLGAGRAGRCCGRGWQALETENAKLATERDILRQAAKYFAGETRW